LRRSTTDWAWLTAFKSVPRSMLIFMFRPFARLDAGASLCGFCRREAKVSGFLPFHKG
jgi:hypothetical protein